MNSLDFTLSLIDNVTKPLKQAGAALKGFADESQKAFKQTAIGAAGLAGALFSMKALLDPALQMNDALQTASLQGVDDSVMKKVTKSAMDFSAQYGKSSVEFTKSALAIRKAISGVADNELPHLTTVTNTTAAALKSTSDEATAYMGQMFSQFSTYADQVGKNQFAEELAGKAVYMSQTFGTSMAEITGLMEGARAAGTNFGIGIDEQLAVLGELQRTLGTEASGAYEGFMTGAADGAKKLGLSFVDASGKMNSMPEMLEKLHQKYGNNIDGNLKAQKEIDDAFGDSAVVVKQLYGDVDVLRKNITSLGANDGMKRTREMAEKLADPWERLMSIWETIRIAVGMTLLPVITPLINKIAEGGQTLVRWLTLFPNIAKWIGYIVGGITGLAAAGAALNVVIGISRLIWAALKAVWIACTAVMKIGTAAVWLYNAAIKAWTVTLRVLRGIMLAVRIAAMTAGISFNFMCLPVLLVIAAIALLAAGVYFLIKYWDEIKAAIMETDAFKKVAAVVRWVGDVFSKVWDGIAKGWDELCKWFTNFSLAETFGNLAKSVKEIFGNVWIWLKNKFAEIYNFYVDKLNYIPGINIELMDINDGTAKNTGGAPGTDAEKAIEAFRQQQVFMSTYLNQQPAAPGSGQDLLTGGQVKGIDKNGVGKGVAGNTTINEDNSRSVGNVTINVKNMPEPQQLAEYEMLQHG
ncbi:TPA: phage tail tape measure protein [Morganella morganii]|nr:phage tail tape measure protein [Morganella morganii]